MSGAPGSIDPGSFNGLDLKSLDSLIGLVFGSGTKHEDLTGTKSEDQTKNQTIGTTDVGTTDTTSTGTSNTNQNQNTLSTGSEIGVNSTVNAASPEAMRNSNAALSMANTMFTDPQDALVNNILTRAAEAFAPQLASQHTAGIYNDTTTKLLSDRAQAMATGEAAKAVLDSKTNALKSASDITAAQLRANTTSTVANVVNKGSNTVTNNVVKTDDTKNTKVDTTDNKLVTNNDATKTNTVTTNNNTTHTTSPITQAGGLNLSGVIGAGTLLNNVFGKSDDKSKSGIPNPISAIKKMLSPDGPEELGYSQEELARMGSGEATSAASSGGEISGSAGEEGLSNFAGPEESLLSSGNLPAELSINDIGLHPDLANELAGAVENIGTTATDVAGLAADPGIASLSADSLGTFAGNQLATDTLSGQASFDATADAQSELFDPGEQLTYPGEEADFTYNGEEDAVANTGEEGLTQTADAEAVTGAEDLATGADAVDTFEGADALGVDEAAGEVDFGSSLVDGASAIGEDGVFGGAIDAGIGGLGEDLIGGIAGDALLEGAADFGFEELATAAIVGWVICTELDRRGLVSDKHNYKNHEHIANLSKITIKGYHTWAIPYVRLMQYSPLAIKIIRPIAQARINHIVGRKNFIGWLTCIIGEPACFIIGTIANVIERIKSWLPTHSMTNR